MPLGANGKSDCRQGKGLCQAGVRQKNSKLVGATLYCDRADGHVGELALALANGMGKEELERVIRPHPTVEESIGEAVLASEGRADSFALTVENKKELEKLLFWFKEIF